MANYRIKLSAIYIIENTITNNYYIGLSKDVLSRWQSHYTLLYQNKHHSPELQNEFNIYGIEAFNFKILEYVSKTEYKEKLKLKGKEFEKIFNLFLLAKERQWMGKYSINRALNQDKKYFNK